MSSLMLPSYSPCALCPRLCGADRAVGERGRCGAGIEMFVARAALHHWEEPPLSGERGSGAIFFSRCALGCIYCQNREIARADAGIAVSVEGLAKTMLSLQAQGALNINCVTPTHHSPRIAEGVAIARAGGLVIPVVWNTSGYERCETISALADTVDIYLADFKYADKGLAAAYSQAPDYPEVALAAITRMIEVAGLPEYDEVDGQARMTSGVIVRHMVLPGALDESIAAIERLFETFGNDVWYSLMNQYTPLLATSAVHGDEGAACALAAYPALGGRVSDEDYERLLDHADALGMQDYFWQLGSAAEESFIPVWDGTGVIPS